MILMAVNKVVYNNNTVMDITDTTATADDVASGKYFYTNAGVKTQGTYVPSGGGLAYADELYSNDSVSITYTATSAGTAKSITGISGLCTYPFIVVIIENTNTTAGSLKFIRSTTVIGNTRYESNAATVARYGTQHYYTSAGALTNLASTSYGLWGYTISTSSSGTLTIRGRCNGSYYTSLTGTYKVKVLGVKF